MFFCLQAFSIVLVKNLSCEKKKLNDVFKAFSKNSGKSQERKVKVGSKTVTYKLNTTIDNKYLHTILRYSFVVIFSWFGFFITKI